MERITKRKNQQRKTQKKGKRSTASTFLERNGGELVSQVDEHNDARVSLRDPHQQEDLLGLAEMHGSPQKGGIGVQ